MQKIQTKPKKGLKQENDTSLTLLEQLLKASVISAYLKNDKSFSVIIIGNAETFKTKTLMKFSKIKQVSVQSDLTYYGIVEEILPKIQAGHIKTLVIPDLLKAVMKKTSTKHNFITCLNGLIEEGIHEVTLRNTKDYEGARCNILTSMTPSIYFDQRKLWNKIGFPSRIIPFSFSYSEKMKGRIFKKIGEYNVKTEPVKVELPMFPVEVEIKKEYADIAERYAISLAESEAFRYKTKKLKRLVYINGGMGFRHKWQFMSMLKSFAVMRNSKKVESVDIEKLDRIAHFINYSFNPYPKEELEDESVGNKK